MATSSKKGKKKNNNSQLKKKGELHKKPVRKLTHREDRNPYRFVWVSILLFFVALLLLISEISYFSNWKADADVVAQPFGAIEKENILNGCGPIGVKCADYLIRELFGIAAVLIPFIILLISLSISNLPRLCESSKRRLLPSVILLCFIPVFLGGFFGREDYFFGAGLGGELGIYIADWLKGYLGEEGTAILLLAISGLLIWVMLNRAVLWIGRKLIAGITIAMTYIVKQFRMYRTRRSVEASVLPWTESDGLSDSDTQETKDNDTSNADTRETELEANDDNHSFGNGSTLDADNSEENKQTDGITSKNEAPAKLQHNTMLLDNGSLAAIITDDYYIYLDVCALTQMEEEGLFVHGKESLEQTDEEIFVITRGEEETSQTDMKADDAKDSETNTEEGEELHEDVADTPKDREMNIKASEATTSVQIDNLVISKTDTEEKVSDRDVDERTLYDPTLELSGYRKPTIDLLRHIGEEDVKVKDEEVIKNKNQIVETLATFGIRISEIEATVGPTVTLYEIKPAPGVRISKIQNLEKDIALALAALGIRIIAPIPGKGTIGIEVPNRNKATVSMYSVIKSAKFHESTAELPIALGKTIQNETLVLDLAKMPHLLVAGATGQGKSVGLNAIITSLLYKKHPAEVKFVMVDPKRLELTPYAALSNHFMAQMEGSDSIILTDTEKVIYTLNSICKEMDDRYRLLESAGVKNLKEYNNKFIHRRLNPEKGHRFLPYIVVIVDEFADLIMTAGREIELPIARIAQLARAAGIHMIIATQRPTTNIITGTIKANFPARMAFRVMSYIDSKTILDRAGADQLIGRGDMLIMSGSDLIRVQCAFVDTPEVEAITQFIGAQHGYSEPYQLPEYQPESDSKDTGSQSSGPMQVDPLLVEVARYVVDNQIGSTSKVQRDFEVGFNRSARIFDQLEKLGIVGRQIGSKPRQVLISDPVSLEHILDRIR